MLLHSYRFWQLLTLPICFGSLHRLLFVHLIVIPGEHSPAWFRLVHDAGKQVRYDRNQAAATFYVRCGSDLKLGYNWIKPLWPKGGITLLDIQSMCLCVEKCVECSCMFINHDESIPDVSSQTVSCTHTIKGETGLYCNGFNLWIAFLNPVQCFLFPIKHCFVLESKKYTTYFLTFPIQMLRKGQVRTYLFICAQPSYVILWLLHNAKNGQILWSFTAFLKRLFPQTSSAWFVSVTGSVGVPGCSCQVFIEFIFILF